MNSVLTINGHGLKEMHAHALHYKNNVIMCDSEDVGAHEVIRLTEMR